MTGTAERPRRARQIREPIVINGFGRGGTNILMNMLLSHPGVCIATGETHKVFKGGELGSTAWNTIRKRLCYDVPVRVASFQNVFFNGLLEPRRIPAFLHGYLDWILFREMLRARHEAHNRLKTEGVEYTADEIARSRLLLKGLNGMVHLTDVLHRMYPDAVFFGLLRNGFAICEGYTRRGVPVERIAEIYAHVAETMLEYAERLPDFHLVRFERILADPRGQMEEVYRLARLDLSDVRKVRLQVKRVMTAEGEHRLSGGHDRQVVWYDPEDFASHISPDVDRAQIERLDPETRERFLQRAGPVMERLGYA